MACIADRQRGGCHYQSNGQCWNWFIGYRDPIANDPQVAASMAANPLWWTGIDPNLVVLGSAVLLVLALAVF